MTNKSVDSGSVVSGGSSPGSVATKSIGTDGSVDSSSVTNVGSSSILDAKLSSALEDVVFGNGYGYKSSHIVALVT